MKARQILLIIAVAFVAASCQRYLENGNKGPFCIDGICYADLQSALDAVPDATMIDEASTGYTKIKLTKDYTGAGGSIDSNATFALDLGPFTFTLIPSEGISLEGGAGMYLCGSGGSLKQNDGRTPAISSEGCFLYIMDDVSVSGGIDAASEIYVDEGFSGRLESDVTLRNSFMKILSAGDGIEIGRLSVSNSSAMTEAALVCCQESGAVQIDAIDSSLDFPVWADSESLVSMPQGRRAHVHSYSGTTHVDATCCSEGYDERICPVCGHVEREYSFEETMDKAPCPPEDLVHVEAVPDFPPYGGCVEHWQCPHCLKCYSDPEGQNEMNPLDLPMNFEIDESLLYSCDDIMDWHESYTDSQTKAGELGVALDMVYFAVSITDFVVFETNTNYAFEKIENFQNRLTEIKDNLTAVQKKMDSLQEQFDLILDHLGSIESRLTEIERRLDADAFKEVVNDFESRRKYMKLYRDQTLLYFEALKNGGADEEAMLKTVSTWARQRVEGTDYAGLTEQLLYDFYALDSEGYVSTLLDMASFVYPWEHNCYNFIYQAVCEYVGCLLPGVMMCAIYYKLDPATEIFREDKLEMLINRLPYISATLNCLPVVFNNRDKNYRKLNFTKESGTFLRDCYVIPWNKSFIYWLDKTHSYCFSFTDSSKTLKTYDSWLNYVGLTGREFITNDEIQTVYNYYDGASKKISVRKAMTNASYSGFNCPSSDYVLFADGHREYKNLSVSAKYPKTRCGIFEWEYLGERYSDFSVWTTFATIGDSGRNNYSCQINQQLFQHKTVRHNPETGLIEHYWATNSVTCAYWATILRYPDDPGFMKELEDCINTQI